MFAFYQGGNAGHKPLAKAVTGAVFNPIVIALWGWWVLSIGAYANANLGAQLAGPRARADMTDSVMVACDAIVVVGLRCYSSRPK